MKRQDELKRLLINNNRRLQALQERKALYGVDSPVSIQTEIAASNVFCGYVDYGLTAQRYYVKRYHLW
jgi:hypothetical protein